MIAAALSSIAIMLMTSLARTMIQSDLKFRAVHDDSDLVMLTSDILRGKLCSYALRTPAGAKIPFTGADTDIFIHLNNVISATPSDTVLIQPGPVGQSKTLRLATLQLVEQVPGTGRLQNRAIFHTIMGNLSINSPVITNIRTVDGTPIPDVVAAYGVTVGQQVIGLGIDNFASNTPPLLGAQVAAVAAGSITMNENSKVAQANTFLQVGGFYKIYSTNVKMTFTDTNPEATAIPNRFVPVTVAVGAQTGTLDQCYSTDQTLLCGAVGGVIDSNGACSHGLFGRLTTAFPCDALHVNGNACVGAPPIAPCVWIYAITGVAANGDPRCSCIPSCPN